MINIAIIGPSGVGKYNFVNRLCYGLAILDYDDPLVSYFNYWISELNRSILIKFSRQLCSDKLSEADGYIIIYDQTRISTLNSCLNILDKIGNKPKILVGTHYSGLYEIGVNNMILQIMFLERDIKPYILSSDNYNSNEPVLDLLKQILSNY